jgi:hypothetical protein
MPDQVELAQLYHRWRKDLKSRPLGFDPKCYSPPLLIKMPEAYCVAERRILFCGQETYGWDFENGATFGDFLDDDNSVEALLAAYETFAFAKNYRSRGSPYWAAFREVKNWKLGDVL